MRRTLDNGPFQLDYKLEDDFEEPEFLAEEDIVEIAVETGSNRGRGKVYRFQYDISAGDVIIAKRR
jgi:hypothetical protein